MCDVLEKQVAVFALGENIVIRRFYAQFVNISNAAAFKENKIRIYVQVGTYKCTRTILMMANKATNYTWNNVCISLLVPVLCTT